MLNGLRSYSIPLRLRISSAASAAARSSDYEALSSLLIDVVVCAALTFYNQTAISAILVVALPNGGTGAERLFDALVGGGIALVFSVLLFPADPVALLRTALDSALAALSGTLTRLDGVIDQHGREPFDAGWTTAEGEALNRSLAGVAEAGASARQVIRAAPPA